MRGGGGGRACSVFWCGGAVGIGGDWWGLSEALITRITRITQIKTYLDVE